MDEKTKNKEKKKLGKSKDGIKESGKKWA